MVNEAQHGNVTELRKLSLCYLITCTIWIYIHIEALAKSVLLLNVLSASVYFNYQLPLEDTTGAKRQLVGYGLLGFKVNYI